MRNSHKKVLSIITVLSILVGFVTPLLTDPKSVYAADVSSYIDLAANGAGPVAPSTIGTAPAVDSGTATDFYLSFTPSGEYGGTETITVNIPDSFTAAADCGSPTTDVDLDTTPDVDTVSVTADGSGGYTATYLLDTATTTAASGGVEVCFNATPSTTRGNYSVYVTDGTDTSTALIYVSDGDSKYDNDVEVRGEVPTNLALRVMDPSSAVVTDICDLGVLNPTAVNTCSYRVAAGTNHVSGLYVEVVADSTLDNATDDIDDVVDTTIDAGTEEHGFQVTGDGSFTPQGTFNSQDNAVPSTETSMLNVASELDDSVEANWATVQHSASVNTVTPAGTYDQLVTYRAFANS